jgi:hypothetical protein
MNSQLPAGAKRPLTWRQLLVFGRWIVEREELPPPREGASTRRTGLPPFRWLASADPLPDRSDSQRHRPSLLPWLASRDRLPSRPVSPHRQSGLFSWLVFREQLPTESSDHTPAPRTFLRWLFTLDPHERLASHSSTKEVPLHEA